MSIFDQVACSPQLAHRLTSAKQCVVAQPARSGAICALAQTAVVGIQSAGPSKRRTAVATARNIVGIRELGATSMPAAMSARIAGRTPTHLHGQGRGTLAPKKS
jgi:hypothetical protein